MKDITLCDRSGAIYEGREQGMNPIKEEMARVTNLEKRAGQPGGYAGGGGRVHRGVRTRER